MRIGSWLLAVVLLGASPMPATFAEEAAHDGGGAKPAAESEGTRPPSGSPGVDVGSHPEEQTKAGRADENDAPHNPIGEEARAAKEVNSSASTGKELNGIDIRITVQPPRRRLDGKHEAAGEAKIKIRPLAAGNPPPRRLSTLGASARVLRSALGALLPRHEELASRDGARHAVPFAAQGPASGISATRGSATGGLAKAAEEHGLRSLNERSIIGAGGLNNASINGTGVRRLGVGPPVLGGPAPAAIGISGTTIRRHTQ